MKSMISKYYILIIFFLIFQIPGHCQELGYDLNHIIYTPGTPNPIEYITPMDSSNLFESQTLDIVNWNVDWLGAPEMVNFDHGDRETHISTVAAEMIDMNADIYALQEVVVGANKGNALEDLVTELNEQAGEDKYAGDWSDYHSFYWEADDPDFPPQCLAYVWNTDVVNINSDTVLLYGMAGNTDFGYGRLPYLLDAHVTLNGHTQRYMLVNLHLKAQTGYASQRKVSMELLRKLLNINYFANNVVIVGDYNVADDPGATGEIADWGFYDDHEEDGLVDYVHAAGRKSSSGYNNIEHTIISNELFDELAYTPESFRNILIEGTKVNGLSSHYAFMTRLYIHEETGNVDPENYPITGDDSELTMLASHYQIIVDFVNDNDLPNTHSYPENTEDYFGASAYYANFDIETDGSWNQDAFDSWQEAVQSGLIEALLPSVFSNAAKDEIYSVSFATWNGSEDGAETFHFVCTESAPDPAFEYYEGPVNGISAISADRIKIYPNPVTNNKLIIDGFTGNASYKIITTQGQVIDNGVLDDKNPEIYLDKLHSGLYLLWLLCNNQIVVEPFVK